MDEDLSILIKYWNMKVKIVIYQKETDAFSNVITVFSRKVLACSISNSYNHIKEKQRL